MRGWLVDNNVPRGLTLLLVDRGEDAVEVRAVLGQDAPDDAVVAFAAAQERWLITHDRGCARNALAKGVPPPLGANPGDRRCRTPETEDAERLRAELDPVLHGLEHGARRVTLFVGSVSVRWD